LHSSKGSSSSLDGFHGSKKDAHSLTSAFTSASAGTGKTTQSRRLCAEGKAALDKGAAFSLSSEKVSEDGLANGGGRVGSSSLDQRAISGRCCKKRKAPATRDVLHGDHYSSGVTSGTPTDTNWVPRTIPRNLTLIDSSSELSAKDAATKLLNIRPSGYSDPLASTHSPNYKARTTQDTLLSKLSSEVLLTPIDANWVPRTIPRNLTLIDSSSGQSVDDVACKLFGIRPIYGAGYGDPQTRCVRRFYQRFFTGVGVGGRLRVLTLTTSNKALAEGKDIHRSFRTFVKRVRRKFGEFAYIGVKEFKGDREHLHLVFRGKYMKQKWISDTWEDIHASPVVYIQAQNAQDGAKYLAKYLAKDVHSRYWCSQNWVFKGWVGWTKKFCKLFGHYPHQSVVQSLARLDVERRREVQQQLIWHERYFVPFHSWRYKAREEPLFQQDSSVLTSRAV